MSKLDGVVIDRAVKALLQYEEKRSNEAENGKKQLLSSYAKPVLVQLQLVSAIKQTVQKPVRVPIPNSLFSPEDEDHSICLFCRTSDKAEIEQLLEKNPIEGFGKVLTLDQVKKQYMLLKDKKRLLREHTHFLVDSRVMQHIYNLLGTTFTSRDHRPVPIELGKFIGAASAPATDAASVAARGGKLAAMVQRAVDSAYFRKSGNTLSIRIGHTGMTAAQVKENIIAGVPAAVEKLSKAWREVHSIHIKTSDSAALPVYSQDSNEMAQYVAQRAKSKPAKASNDAAAPADGSKSEVATTGADSKKKKAAAKAAATPQETKSPASSAKAATSSKTKATKVLKKSPQSAAAPGKTTRTTKAKTAGATGKAARRALLKA